MLKGIQNPTGLASSRMTTKIPGTGTPLVPHSSDTTFNKEVGNSVKNALSSQKNPFMGQKASNTLGRNHQQKQASDGLPSIKTGFESSKLNESEYNLRGALIMETTYLRNIIDHKTGGKDLGSGTKKEANRVINDPHASPKKFKPSDTDGIQGEIGKKKKNTGLDYLSKVSTQKKNQGLL